MTYFKKKRAIAGGLAIAGSSLGGVIFPIIAVHLIPRIGFPWTMRACAFLILGLLITTNLTISSNLQYVSRPFKLSEYLSPLRELKFLIMCLRASSSPVSKQSCSSTYLCCKLTILFRGNIYTFKLPCRLSIRYGMSTTMAINLIPILNGAR